MTVLEPGASDIAGASANEQAALFEPVIASTQRQINALTEALRELRRSQRAWRLGARGERRAAQRIEQVMLDLGSNDWHLLADRRWPGTRQANLDLVLVGPPGVLVLDAKAWRDVRIESGQLWHGQELADETLLRARRAADDVAAVVASDGLAPAAVRPVVLLVGRHLPAVEVDGVWVVGELDLHRALVRLGARLDRAQVAQVLAAVDRGCPPAVRAAVPAQRTVPDGIARTAQQIDQQALLDLDQVWADLLETAEREPIETWMTWLHPSQAQLVTRRYSGPARVRGPAGTGKTVVALHRVRELARRPNAHVLMTSYVRTLPHVHKALFRRLAPELVNAVEFRGLHAWAVALLRSRGRLPAVAPDAGRRIFDEAWAAMHASDLPVGRNGVGYWWDEIQHVIKARGLTSADDYVALHRVGRRTPMREENRRALWRVYEEYERRLVVQGLVDWPDVLLLALASVRAEPLPRPYTSVVVDEVQDLTCVGLQLLHALVGDRPDGLFLVGDGQQSVYPGGFTLAEAGVSVAGRATVLDRNYRNKDAIMRAALDVVQADTFDDLDDALEQSGGRSVSTARSGGKVVRVLCDDGPSQQAALLHALKCAAADGVRLGDMAILVAQNHQAERWIERMSRAGVKACRLTDYDGTSTDLVKVGTYQRAKGFEFACVFLPDHDRAVTPRKVDEAAEVFGERSTLERRCVFVAMTRARDRLWLGSVRD